MNLVLFLTFLKIKLESFRQPVMFCSHFTKLNPMPEKLTPIYAVSYHVKGISGNNKFFLSRQLNDSDWEKLQRSSTDRFPNREVDVTFTDKEKAISKAKELKNNVEYYDISVIHYGFKERGFRKESREKDILI